MQGMYTTKQNQNILENLPIPLFYVANKITNNYKGDD